MDHHTKNRNNQDDTPKFGRLLVVCVLAVALCGVLTWVMATYFPDFPNW